MDFIKECLKDNEAAIMEQLQGAGFSTDQARQFLPEAASGFGDSTRDGSAEQVAAQLVSNGPGELLSSVNTEAIAEKLGMSPGLVRKGFAAIAPVIAQMLAQKSDGLAGAVTSLAPGLLNRFS